MRCKLVSSVLGVAAGELLVPALVLIFGADIKTAGSASIIISLGIVSMGYGATCAPTPFRMGWRSAHYDSDGGRLDYRRNARRPRRGLSAGRIPQGVIGMYAARRRREDGFGPTLSHIYYHPNLAEDRSTQGRSR